jgi:hypothetical protein
MVKKMKYFVSQDVGLILKGNNSFECLGAEDARKRPSYDDTISKVREDLKTDLENIFPDDDIVIIPEQEMLRTARSQIKNCRLPIVSMDRVYAGGNNADITKYLEITRDGAGGYISRNRNGVAEPLDIVIRKLCGELKNEKHIAILDDVLYSGETMLKVVNEFKKNGVQVDQILVGLAKDEASTLYKSEGIDLQAGRIMTNLRDELCERDFFFGVPHSGTQIGGTVTEPYFLPFSAGLNDKGENKMEGKTSIPPLNQIEFSQNCIKRSLNLWQDIERKRQLHGGADTIRRTGLPASYVTTMGDLYQKVAGTVEERTVCEQLLHSAGVIVDKLM